MRHVPERTCVACRAKRPKSELLRVVRRPDLTDVQLDEHQQLPGRGAYMCRAERCWQAGISRRGIDRTLRLSVPAAVRQKLLQAFTMGVK